MRTTIFALTTAVACAALSGWTPEPVRADTFPLVAGMQTNGGPVPRSFDWNYWAEGAIGLARSQETVAHYVAPVYWRTFPSGTRTMRVRGIRTSSTDDLGCTLFVMDDDGFVVSQDWGLFSTVGSYSWITLDVTGVTPDTNSFLSCSGGIGAGYLLFMSYTP